MIHSYTYHCLNHLSGYASGVQGLREGASSYDVAARPSTSGEEKEDTGGSCPGVATPGRGAGTNHGDPSEGG